MPNPSPWSIVRWTLPAIALCGPLLAQNLFLVVPAGFATDDAPSHMMVAGVHNVARQQTLIGQSHLQSLIGRDLWALELRRSARDEAMAGGTANIAVTLSTSPNPPLFAAPGFGNNHGPDAVPVFTGAVTVPTSPAIVGPAVPWTVDHVIRIPFQMPFRYTGGTLCVDLIGLPTANQTATWWMADAVWEELSGTVTSIGDGCGQYGGPSGAWSHMDPRSAVPGDEAVFSAYGSHGGIAVAFVGGAGPSWPLALTGLPGGDCDVHLAPNQLLAAFATTFVTDPRPILHSLGGYAEVTLRVPPAPWVFGLTLTTQWLDLAQPATSNALQWTLASAIPGLDMALVSGEVSDLTGGVGMHMAHVFRFEYR